MDDNKFFFGNDAVDEFFVGADKVDEIYLGESLIYDKAPQPPITDGLVLWLHGADKVKNKWIDRSGSGYHFDIIGTPQQSGNHIYFDGSTYCTLDQSMTNIKTIIVMLKHYKNDPTQSAWKYLMDSRNNSLSTGQIYIAGNTSPEINQFSGISSTITKTDGTTLSNIPAETMVHFCATFNTAPETLNFVLCSNHAKRETLMCDIYEVLAYNRILTEEELDISLEYMKSITSGSGEDID